ncbi:hypothetical protein ACUX44_26200, partial [Salmonella enterica]
QGDDIRKFQFWSGIKGGLVGRLRSIFGGLFVRVVEVAAKVKLKVQEKLKNFQFGADTGGGSRLARVARIVGARILKYMGGVLVDRTMTLLRQ